MESNAVVSAHPRQASAARQRARTVAMLRRFLAPLGCTEPRETQLIAQLLSALPPDVRPRQAVAAAYRRFDQWLAGLVETFDLPVPVSGEMRHSALLSLDPGVAWPDALLVERAPEEFLRALREALPIAVPPEQPLLMPEQALDTVRTAGAPAPPAPRSRRHRLRRTALFGGTIAATAGGTWALGRVFDPGGISPIEMVLMALFAINFAFIALTFLSAIAGLVLCLRGAGSELAPPDLRRRALRSRTVVLVPTYNEIPERVFAAVEAIYRSLQATGQLAAFDFFVISDSTDPEAWVREELAWDRTRRRLGATGRLFYRRRTENLGRKAGNLAEFCRRWGGRYASMLVLDADSLMAGETIVQLEQLMEANPHVGILQTVPRLVNRNTLFARAQQFATAVYGPVLAAGLAWWYGGDGNYWGHNALIRVRAFAENAGLPVLSGRAPFGGHILSHDFVEAALMRRAGWRVVLLPELEGSYEESPPSLLDHAARDRRWCQGNLQHLALLRAAGLHPLSRFHLVTGIMSYLASPLWFGFLLVGIFAAFQSQLVLPVYFFPDRTPYPVWHVIDPELALRLFYATLFVLLAPKLFGWLALALRPGRAHAFGGRLRLLAGVVSETLYSALIAPVQMLLQSRFVFDVLLGRDSGWRAQTRDDRAILMREAWHAHRHHAQIGIALAVLAYMVYPALLGWMMPALAGMILAAPASYLGARASVGRAARRLGLFVIPEEHAPPAILREASAIQAHNPPITFEASAMEAVVYDRWIGHLHLALLTQEPARPLSEALGVAGYRAECARQRADFTVRFDRATRAAALANPRAVRWLRRRFGRFRD